MTLIELSLNRAAEAWWGILGRACWQGGAMLALVWLICLLLPRLQANVRCWLWRLATLKLLLALFLVTPIDIPLLPGTGPTLSAGGAADVSVPASARVMPEADRSLRGPLSRTGNVSAQTLVPEVWLLLFWLSATGVGAWRILAANGNVRRLRTGAEALEEPEILAACRNLCEQFGLQRCPPVLLIDAPYTALAHGIARPVILIGKTLWREAGPEERRLILAHELAHLSRRDLLWNWLPILARTLFFFHPLVWLAEREGRQLQEMACDAHVIHRTQARLSDYGATLLKAATQNRSARPRQATALSIIESYDTLQRRLEAMKHIRLFSPRHAVLSAAALVTAGVFAVVPWRLTAAPGPKSVVLLDHSKCHSASDAPFGMIFDQEMQDNPDQTTYAVAAVDVPANGWLVDSITVYFACVPNEKISPPDHDVPHPDGWLKVEKGRLNIFPRTGQLPTEKDDPTKSTVVTLTQKQRTNGVYAMTVSGLNRKLAPGKYWIGLTPVSSWKRNGQGYHLMMLEPHKGVEGAMRNPSGKSGFDRSDWAAVSDLYPRAPMSHEEPAIKIEGEPREQKPAETQPTGQKSAERQPLERTTAG